MAVRVQSNSCGSIFLNFISLWMPLEHRWIHYSTRSPHYPPETIAKRLIRTEAERSFVFWLVEANFAAAGQLDGCFDSPPLFADLGALDVLTCESLDFRAQVFAHQIENGAKQSPAAMSLSRLAIGGMKRSLGRGQRKNQPASSDVHGGEFQDVTEERAIRFWVFAVHKNVRAVNHERSSSEDKIPQP